jgi:predicted RNase H-like HicB family nuclease
MIVSYHREGYEDQICLNGGHRVAPEKWHNNPYYCFIIGDLGMKYRVILEQQEEGGFTVYVPTLPGCVSQGETKEEALANIKEAIEVYLESLKERGLSSPEVKEYEVVV